MIYQAYDIAPYHSKVVIGVAKDRAKIVDKLNKDYVGVDLEWDGSAYATTTSRNYLPSGKMIKFYGIKTNRKALHHVFVILPNDAPASVIAHEGIHVANFIFRNVGAKPDLDNDEPMAYLLGDIVSAIDDTIKEYKKLKPHQKK